MKKKLFTLLLCAFAWINANAFNISDDGTTLTFTSSADAAGVTKWEDLGISREAAANITKIVMAGDFSTGWSGSWLVNGGSDDPTNVTEIDMSGVTAIGGSWGFDMFNNLESITWPTNNCIEVIPSDAFKSCAFTSLTIPTSVKTIEATAFNNCSLVSLTIPKNSQLEIIKKNAFAQCTGLREVNVLVTPRAGSGTDTNYGDITYFPWCEENGFPYDIIVQQTSISNNSLAVLNFDEDWFDFFCGDWKKGLAFTQKNLNSIKDGYYDDNNNKLGPNNGWQQFAMTGSPSEQVVPQGAFVRTFSSSTPYVIPEYRYQDTNNGGAWVSSDIFRCYIVSGYTYSKSGSNVQLTRLENVMPENTGMILRSTELNENDALVFMVEATRSKYSWTTYPWGSGNYLETSIEETPIEPCVREGGKVTYRNFGLYEAGGGYQFVRYKKGKIRENRAYLKLTAEQFPNSNEDANSGPGVSFDGAGDAKIFLVFEDVDDQAGEVTGIKTVSTKQIDNTYYNLQGMKVENPSKGIYIYNGKKVIK